MTDPYAGPFCLIVASRLYIGSIRSVKVKRTPAMIQGPASLATSLPASRKHPRP